MDGRLRVLSRLNGPPNAAIMLVGEAPGRLGAERSAIPFAGDESGRRLDRLIAAAGWNRAELFITNAVLCNPLDTSGRNRSPSRREQAACSSWLARQVQVVNPRLVIALGAVALESLRHIAPHDLTLKDAVATPVPWHGRWLGVAYHPGARAALHRPMDKQLADFAQFGEWSRMILALSAESSACR
jgi:uracil-DNA glycosylase family 4